MAVWKQLHVSQWFVKLTMKSGAPQTLVEREPKLYAEVHEHSNTELLNLCHCFCYTVDYYSV